MSLNAKRIQKSWQVLESLDSQKSGAENIMISSSKKLLSWFLAFTGDLDRKHQACKGRESWDTVMS